MKAKVCTKCGENKVLSEYNKHRQAKDGLHWACKKCLASQRKHYYKANNDAILDQKRRYYKRNQRTIRNKQSEYYKDNQEEILERVKQYSIDNRSNIIEYQKEYRRNNREKLAEKDRRRKSPEQIKAGGKVAYAVKRGALPHISTCVCEHCGERAANYHHEDYSKPLKVMSLCKSCHSQLHANKRRSY